ncbi:MAG: hypothetical protein V2I34_04765 [Bacteroidales bacterium]|jgi:hypothetical protein|nr:hypothetical protein [Bacteroidales bacterium]
MEINVDSQKKYTCHICSKDINVLTKKLQEHPTSGIWVRHGQCCAACVAPEDITGLHDDVMVKSEYRQEGTSGNKHNGDPHTNILSGLERAVEIEELKTQNNERRAKRTATAGRITVVSSLAAGFLFFYYELFILALICLIICITGIIVYRKGTVKQFRTNSY